MRSAPARMKPRWSERTLSGARMFASSGQRSRATALDDERSHPAVADERRARRESSRGTGSSLHSTTARGGIARRTLPGVSSALPTGTVTFLFTDVEGSTRLLEELGAERTRSSSGGTARSFVGRSPSTEASRSTRRATRSSARSGRRGRRSRARPRSRMRCERARPGPHGDPHRARLSSSIGTTWGWTCTALPGSAPAATEGRSCSRRRPSPCSSPTSSSVRDLGVHRLKDLAAPVWCSTSSETRTSRRSGRSSGRTSRCRRRRSSAARRSSWSSLRVPRTPGVRVLTLTGPGRHGQDEARTAARGGAVRCVSGRGLVGAARAAPRRERSSPRRSRASLEVEEESGRALADSIASSLARKRALLLLDNCEHLVDAVARLVAGVVGWLPGRPRRRDEPRGAGHRRRARLSRYSRSSRSDAVELFHARARAAGARLDTDATRCGRRGAVRAPRQSAARRRARGGPGGGSAAGRAPRASRHAPRHARRDRATPRSASGHYGPRSHGATTSSRSRSSGSFDVWLCSWAARRSRRSRPSATPISRTCFRSSAKSLVRHASSEGVEPRYWMLETIREFAAEELDRVGRARRSARSAPRVVRRSAHGRRAASSTGPNQASELAHLERRPREPPCGVRLGSRSRLVRRRRCRHRAGAVTTSFAAGMSTPRTCSACACARLLTPLDDGLPPRPTRDRASAPGRSRRGTRLRSARPRRVLEALAERGRRMVGALDRSQARPGALLLLRERPGSRSRHVDRRSSSRGSQSMGHRGQQARVAPRASSARVPDRAVRPVRARPRRSCAGPSTRRRRSGTSRADFMLGFCLLWRGKLEEAEEYLERGRESRSRARRRADRDAMPRVRARRAAAAERSRGRTSLTRRDRGTRRAPRLPRSRERERRLARVAGWRPRTLVVRRAETKRSLTGFRRPCRLECLRVDGAVSAPRRRARTRRRRPRPRARPRDARSLAAAAARRDRGCGRAGRRDPVASRTCSRRSTSPALRLLVGVKRSSQLRTRERSSALGCRPRRGNRPQCGHSRRAAMRRPPE